MAPVLVVVAAAKEVLLLPVVALTDLVPVLDAVLAGVWGILAIAVIVLLTIRVVARWT